MISLPIVGRELRIASRRRGTYWLRAVLAAFGVLACLQWFGGGSVSLVILSVMAAPLLLAKNIFFLAWASRRLKNEFRTSERSFLNRLSRWFAASRSEKLPAPELQSALK